MSSGPSYVATRINELLRNAELVRYDEEYFLSFAVEEWGIAVRVMNEAPHASLNLKVGTQEVAVMEELGRIGLASAYDIFADTSAKGIVRHHDTRAVAQLELAETVANIPNVVRYLRGLLFTREESAAALIVLIRLAVGLEQAIAC